MNIKSLLCPPRRLAVGIAALALCWPLIAAADCTARKPKAAEIEFNTRALAALVAALPPAPAGVQMSEDRPAAWGLCQFGAIHQRSPTGRVVQLSGIRFDERHLEFHPVVRKTAGVRVSAWRSGVSSG